MTARQHLSHADEIWWGNGFNGHYNTAGKRRGVKVDLLSRVSLGAPAALNATGIVNGATSTELPNNTTTTYTTANTGSSPFDDAGIPAVTTIVDSGGVQRSVWPLDVARNLTLAVTHGSSVVALSVTVSGFDAYGVAMTETLSVTGGSTSKSAAGKKAFQSILSIAITSAGNATTNTLNLGWGDVLGLPFVALNKRDILSVSHNDAVDASATVVAAVTSTPSATTGDIRGTIDPASACNATNITVVMFVDPSNNTKQFGGAQA